MDRITNVFKKHKIIILSIILIIIFIVIYRSALFTKCDQQLSNQANTAEIATALTAIISAVYIACQYKDTVRKQKIEKAIQLTEQYAKEIIPLSEEISKYYVILYSVKNMSSLDTKTDNMNFVEYLEKKFEQQTVKKFDKEEYEKIFTEKDRLYLEKEAKKDFVPKLKAYFNNHFIENNITSEKEKTAFVIKHLNDFEKKKGLLLNTLEAWAMNFDKNIANSDTAYQSLHNSFFIIVAMNYCNITKNNNSNKVDKFYTSIKNLYNEWKKVYKEQLKQIKKNEEKSKVKTEKTEEKFNNKGAY